MVILLMGVSGSGKSTTGQLLADTLNWRFVDADDFHSAANIAKMSAGVALTEDDRRPWLEALQAEMKRWIDSNENVVLACSALKREYRDMLVVNDDVKLVFLRGSYDLISQRLAGRQGHYMHPDLLSSQFATLEDPADAIAIDISATPEDIVLQIRRGLQI